MIKAAVFDVRQRNLFVYETEKSLTVPFVGKPAQQIVYFGDVCPSAAGFFLKSTVTRVHSAVNGSARIPHFPDSPIQSISLENGPVVEMIVNGYNTNIHITSILDEAYS
jgi:hypothetical protein